jgi:hypothetical protein
MTIDHVLARAVVRVAGAAMVVGIAVVAGSGTAGCRRAGAGAPGAAGPIASSTDAALPFSIEPLFTAAELRFDAVRVSTTFHADEDGRTTSSDSETHWTLTCTQTPRPAPAGRRVAELTCVSRQVPDDEDVAPAAPTTDAAGEDDDADLGEPFPLDLDGFWIATADGVWHVTDVDEPLEPLARLMSLPPAARLDEVPDPDGDPDDHPPAQLTYQTRRSDDGAWCYEYIADPGGGGEASTWSMCLDARGLLSASTSDGHGADVWEASVTRR